MYAFQFIICYLMFHKACREMPLGEGLRYQIEVQRKLQEQLEVSLMVQCKRSLYSLAEKSFCFDTNSSCGSLEATRAQLMDFDLALSGLMEDVSWVCEEKHSELREVWTQDNIKRSNSSGCQLYQEDRLEADDSSLLLLDLNVEGTSEEMV
ncbi:hypothetical protein GW17_00060001, partial [Ensete ventricosum]